MANRTSVGYRLSEGALKLLFALSASLGLSKTAVIEIAVRELAKRNKITFIPTEREDNENHDVE
jgi:hypothetical protein